MSKRTYRTSEQWTELFNTYEQSAQLFDLDTPPLALLMAAPLTDTQWHP